MDREKMTELKRSVDAASGPDRVLDNELHKATNKPLPVGFNFGNVPRYTASIDAALELVGRVLPEWEFGSFRVGKTFGLDAKPVFFADLRYWRAKSDGSTLPLAILNALLAALIAAEGE